ncbi:MAG: aminotransferase class I/II-fold pyridoxal phosphate-dependent enzyme [Marinicella sp.]
MTYKLDFNERADSKPQWLSQFELKTDELWRYPDRGQLELQMADDMDLQSGSVLLTNGGDESIELLYKKCKLESQSLLIPEPCFSQYTHNQSIWQNETVFISACDDLSIDIDGLKSGLRANQWLILTRPNNPTGEYLASEVLLDLIQTADKQGAYVFLDEAYVEFTNQDSPIDYTAFDNLVTLRTFSKAYGLAGARVGYIFGQPELIQQFRRLAMPFNVSRANLQLAAAAWDARAEVGEYTQIIAQNRTLISQMLEAAGLKPFPSQGNFVLFETHPLQKQLMVSVLNKAGIQIKAELGGLPQAVRITIPEKLEPLQQALQLVLQPQVLAFDMDGVLIDTSNSYDTCIKQTVQILTDQTITQQQVEDIRAEGGYNNDWVLAAELIKRQGIEVPFDQVVDVFQKLYLGDEQQVGLRLQEQNLIAGSLKAKLDKLSQTTFQAVVTGRPRAEAVIGVAQLAIKPDVIISADDVLEQKPNPEGLFKVLKNAQSQRGWFCGDTVDDMQAGTQAGCVCIGIGANTAEAKQNLLQAGADVVLADINQLETLL